MFVIVLFFLPFISSFNVNTNFPIVYINPAKISNKSSYFGYSLVLYPGQKHTNQSWIFIGAPRSENSGLKKYKNSGTLFKCEIKKPCTEVSLPSNIQYQQAILNNSWIGGSMDISYKYEHIVTCAHRWVDKVGEDYRMHGSCFWFHPKNSDAWESLRLFPKNSDTKKGVYFYGQGQFGTSIHMPSQTPELLLGAPGVYNWDGTSVLYRGINFTDVNIIENDAIRDRERIAFSFLGYSSTSGYFYDKNKLFYVSGAPKSSDWHGKVLIYKFPNVSNRYQISSVKVTVKDRLEGSQFGEYFGASLTAGDINNDGFDDLIIGAPFYSEHKMKYNEGRVYIFKGSKNRLLEDKRLIGKSINGQFGSCVQYLGDINADGYGDLAISAPYENERSGVVYLYRGTHSGIDKNYCQKIVGRDVFPEILGFGISIARTADIDHNGVLDVAVGAYLSGHTVILRTHPVVTIYHSIVPCSSKLDITKKFFNISVCFWFSMNQPNANISIRRNVTVDEALGRGKLIGAETVETLILTETVCKNLTIKYEAIYLNESFTVSLNHELISEETRKQAVFISERNVNGSDLFCPNCPVYDKYGSSRRKTISVPFTLNCGFDDICKSILEFEARITDLNEDNVFVLGSTNTLTLETFIKNLGENAYSTKIIFNIPEIVNLENTPSKCEQKSSSVICDVADPLETNHTRNMTLYLDMTEVNEGMLGDFLVIRVSMETNSINTLNDVKTLLIKLQRNVDITISGKSKEVSYLYKWNNKNDTNFVQMYLVRTIGLSPLDEVSVTIDIPHFIKTADGHSIEIVRLYPLKATQDDKETVSCASDFAYVTNNDDYGYDSDNIIDSDKEIKRKKKRSIEANNKLVNATEEQLVYGKVYDVPTNRTFYINCSKPEIVCSKLICLVRSVKPGQIVKIKMNMLLNTSAVQNFLKKNDFIIFTSRGYVSIVKPSGFVQSGDRPDMIEVSSTFIGENITELLPLWIFILSIVVGLLLLLVLILVLIKAGFFQRKTKEELEELKKEMEFAEEQSQS